jgi:hypothetical protein
MTLGNAYYNKLITPKYRDGLEFLLENKEDDWLHANVMVHHELSTPFKIFFESIVASAGLRGLAFIFLAQDAQELLGWWLNPWVVGAAVTLHTIISRHKASYEGNYLPFKQCVRILNTILAEAKAHAPNASSESIILAMLIGLDLDKNKEGQGIAKETVDELVKLYDENNLRALTKKMVAIINDNTNVNQSCLRTVANYPKDSMLSIAVVGAIGSGIGYACKPYLESAFGSNHYTLAAIVVTGLVTGGAGILLGKLYASGEITRIEEEAALKYLTENKEVIVVAADEKKGSVFTTGLAHFINGVANFGLRGFAGAGQTFNLFYNLSGTTPESKSSTFIVTTGFGGNLFLAANSAKNFYADVKETLDDYAEWIGNSRIGKGASKCCMRLFSTKPVNENPNEGSKLVLTHSRSAVNSKR